MKVTIRDKAVLVAVPPLDLAVYLRTAGWRPESSAGNGSHGPAATWVRGGNGEGGYEVLIPLNRLAPDYALRIGDALRTLETVEGRSQAEILDDLLAASADVIRVRLGDERAADGTLPIDDCVRVVQKTRDMMMAAACAAVAPRRLFHNRKPAAAVE